MNQKPTEFQAVFLKNTSTNKFEKAVSKGGLYF